MIDPSPRVYDGVTAEALSKRQIKQFAIAKRNRGEYFDRSDALLEDIFRGSIDRFCETAWEFRHFPKFLDVGSGEGLLVSLMKMLGHDVFAVDLHDRGQEDVYRRHEIGFHICNIEADVLPLESGAFDAISCCQAFEHFTHSHLRPLLEMKRVLKVGGRVEIDVPNVASYRNRSRILRGKNITYDYKKHYLYAEPVVYAGREYYPDRHNREFTRDELALLLHEAGFKDVDVRFLKSRRYRTGIERLKSIGTAAKDLVPGFRKSLIAFGVK